MAIPFSFVMTALTCGFNPPALVGWGIRICPFLALGYTGTTMPAHGAQETTALGFVAG